MRFISLFVTVAVGLSSSSAHSTSSASRQDVQVSTQFIEAIQPKRKAVIDLAFEVQNAFSGSAWCASSAACNSDCFYHDCDGRAGIAPAAICTDEISACNCPDRTSSTTARGLLLGNIADSTARQTTCDICDAYQEPKKRLLNFQQPNFRTPPGAIKSEGNNASIEVVDPKLRRDFCALKTIGTNIRDAHSKNGLKAWLYAATTNGAFMKFPGAPFCRDESSSDPLLSCSYDPTGRPWYITAATGPRDIVFMFDDKIGSATPLHSALLQTLGHLDARDAVSLQTFGERSVTPVGDPNAGNETAVPKPGNLNLALPPVRNGLRSAFKQLQLGAVGKSNLTLALETAFDVISKPLSDESEDSSNCERYIVLMIGSEDLCFECKSPPCNCVSQLQALVNRRQAAFDEKPVSLIVFTQARDGLRLEAVSNMERMGSTVACPRGVWSRVDTSSSGSGAMSAFPKFGAFLLFDETNSTRKLFSSAIYDDAAGLGRMFTLAIPIYDVASQNLVAVAGADITVAEVREKLPDGQDAEEEIERYSKSSRGCVQPKPKTGANFICQADAFRASLGSSRVCPDPPRSSSSECVRFGSSLLFRRGQVDRLSFSKAREACANETGGGSLAILNTRAMNKFFTSLTDADGTWIGLRAERGVDDGALRWESGVPLSGNYRDYGFDFNERDAVAELFEQGEDACVSADRRGATGNWNVMSCDRELPYVCQLASTTGEACSNIDDQPAPTCDTLDSKFNCSSEQDEQIRNADPLCKQTGKDMSEADRKCCGAKKAVVGPGEDDDGGLAGWVIAVIVVGVVVVILGACVLMWFVVVLPRRKQNKGDEEEFDEGAEGDEDRLDGGGGDNDNVDGGEAGDGDEDLDTPLDDPFTPSAPAVTVSGPRSSDETFNPQVEQAVAVEVGGGRSSDDTFNPVSEPAPFV